MSTDTWRAIMDLNERVARLEERIESLEKKIDDLKRSLDQRNTMIKYMIYVYMGTLGFVASLFGLGWRPP